MKFREVMLTALNYSDYGGPACRDHCCKTHTGISAQSAAGGGEMIAN